MALILLTLIYGTIEVGLMMFAANVIESATTNTARLGKTGFTASGISREQTIINAINARAGALMNTSNITISSKVYPAFGSVGAAEPFVDSNNNGIRNSNESFTDINGNGQWDADMGVAGLGNAGDIVLYTVSYPWPIATPFIAGLLGSNGTITLSARTVVRNEPYNVN